jgi:hypothetical protein
VNAGFVMLVRASLYWGSEAMLYPIIIQLRAKEGASHEFAREMDESGSTP